MTAARVAVLTPPGTGAIATVAVAGPGAWNAVRTRFRPAGRTPLPDEPTAGRFWFGTLGGGPGDEVVVAVPSTFWSPPPLRGRVRVGGEASSAGTQLPTAGSSTPHPNPPPQGGREQSPDGAESRVKIHCHGGRRVVRWVVEQLVAAGCVEVPAWDVVPSPPGTDPRALEPLSHAPTLRSASILLDQYHGTFSHTVGDALTALDRDHLPLARQILGDLARFAPVGRHLVTPWKVVIAGPPNVGKSSLINALAGYQRSVVAPVAGTTRDVVTAAVAFAGWPVELSDTAGLRTSSDALEAEGVELARGRLAAADLVVWVIDVTEDDPVWPGPDAGPDSFVVVNKTDRPARHELPAGRPFLAVSAETGAGVSDLAAAIAARLIPDAPTPGAAVPFTPALADAVAAAFDALTAGDVPRARAVLAGCAGLSE